MNIKDIQVVICDDVNAMRVQIKELLKSVGFEHVHLTTNGQEAIGALDQMPVHLVLCDWKMSPVDGMELLSYIKQHPKHNAVAFLMVTGETSKELVIQAITAGVDDYIVKPLTSESIQSKVLQTLKKKGVIQ